MLQKILQYRELIQFLLLIGVIYLLSKFLLVPYINTPEFKFFIESIGFFGYLVVIAYIVVSHVFAPISGTPALAFGVMVYGLNTGMWLVYYAGLISCVINFSISRKYGRQLVKKMVGKDAMREIDKFTSIEGTQILWVCRLLGFSFFDFLSYAAGLTKIKFLDYFFITAVSSLITNLAVQYLFRDVNFQTEEGVAMWLLMLGIAAVIFGIFIKFYLHKYKKENTKADDFDPLKL